MISFSNYQQKIRRGTTPNLQIVATIDQPGFEYRAVEFNSNDGDIATYAFSYTPTCKVVRIFNWNSGTTTLSSVTDSTPNTLGDFMGWNAAGTLLAVRRAGMYPRSVCVYSWDGSNLVVVATFPDTYGIADIKWHPTDDFLIVYNSIFSWDGANLNYLSTYGSAGSAGQVRWSPCGNYFATARNYGGTSMLKVYSWDGISSGTLIDTYVFGPSDGPRGLDWNYSSDGLVVTTGVQGLSSFTFDGASLVMVSNINGSYYTAARIYDSQFVVALRNSYYLSYYSYDSSTKAIALVSTLYLPTYSSKMDIDSTGKYAAVGAGSRFTIVQIY